MNCVYEKERGGQILKVSYVHRMNVDESGLRQHERGFVFVSVWLIYFSVMCLDTSALSRLLFFILQVTMEFGLDKRAQTLQGLAFPLQEEAKRALQQLKQRRINYIQLVSSDKDPLSRTIWMMMYLILWKQKNKLSWSIFETICVSVFVSEIGFAWLDPDPWTKLACVCCVAETGCRERNHWAGSHQTYRDPWASLQDSHRFTQIPLLHLQTFPPGPDAGGAGSVHTYHNITSLSGDTLRDPNPRLKAAPISINRYFVV